MSQFADNIQVDYNAASKRYYLTIEAPHATVTKEEMDHDRANAVANVETSLLLRLADTLGPLLADADPYAVAQFHEHLARKTRKRQQATIDDQKSVIRNLRQQLADARTSDDDQEADT